MPLSGEYEPSTSDWARENAEKYMESGGTEGTELNGRRIRREELTNGDRITVGATDLIFGRSRS